MAEEQKPKLAVVMPREGDLEAFKVLITCNDYSIIEVSSIENIENILESIDALIIPANDGLDAEMARLCLEIRSTPKLQNLNVIAIAQSRLRTAVKAMYEIGVDLFILPPFDPEIVNLQIRSALRRTAADKATRPSGNKFIEVADSLEKFAEHLPLAIGLVFKDGLVLTNKLAERIVGELTPSKAEADNLLRDLALERTERITSINTISGETRRILVSTVSPGHDLVCVIIKDADSSQPLQAMIEQDAKIRDLCLLLAAVYLRSASNSRRPTTLGSIDLRLGGEEEKCRLTPILTPLLELFDIVLSPTFSIRVKQPKDFTVKIAPSCLFVTLGRLIMRGLYSVGTSGEAELSLERYDQDQALLRVVVKSRTEKLLAKEIYLETIEEALMKVSLKDAEIEAFSGILDSIKEESSTGKFYKAELLLEIV